MDTPVELTYIGEIESQLKTLEDCPKQGREGAPSARIKIFPPFREAMKRLMPGAKVVILTWFHKADRDTLCVHPRGNPENALTGVFLTRSPNRPNPIGLHEVRITALDQDSLTVEPMEALDGTPVVDIKLHMPLDK